MSEVKTGFGVTAEVDDSVNPAGNYISLKDGDKPIDTGRFIESIVFNDGEGVNAYIEVTIVDTEGKNCSRRYFEPKVDGTIIKDEKDLAKKQAQFSKLLANIGRRFLGKDYVMPETSSFAEFCNKFISDLGDKYKGVELRVKLVLNNKNYTTLAAYAPVIELASVPENESTLKIGSIDKVTVDTPTATTADAPTTPASSTSASAWK